MAEVWDDARWGRSARRWQIAVLLVVLAVAAVVCWLFWPRGQPKIPARVYRSVAGPQVRIVYAESGTIPGVSAPVEYLVVDVDGTDPPEKALQAALLSDGWQVAAADAVIPLPI